MLGGSEVASVADTARLPASQDGYGPGADYPVVLGDPFMVDGVEYTPEDTLNYDEVGYAALDGGAGVTVAHRTLPLPSYVEITSLDSGTTILARVERRGPMTGSGLIALAPDAAQLLGATGADPVRVRRVNPPESHRAELRRGLAAPERMETPLSLVKVLRRKLPPAGSASLQQARAASPQAAASPAPVERSFDQAFTPPRAVAAYPLPPADSATQVRPVAPTAIGSAPRAPTVQADPAGGRFVIQAAAFASQANADRAARQMGGFVTQSGRYFQVRTGPYATRGQAEAALAKVRAAGYSDARVSTTG